MIILEAAISLKSRASTTFFKENFYENYRPFKDELKFFEIA